MTDQQKRTPREIAEDIDQRVGEAEPAISYIKEVEQAIAAERGEVDRLHAQIASNSKVEDEIFDAWVKKVDHAVREIRVLKEQNDQLRAELLRIVLAAQDVRCSRYPERSGISELKEALAACPMAQELLKQKETK